MIWAVYNLVFPVVFTLMLPKFIVRMVRRGGYGSHFEQRLGHFGRNTKARLRETRRIWVHAVSVGEIFVALRLIRAWRAANPDLRFALSTTTSTGHRIARKHLDERDVLFYFPVDLPPIVAKVLRIVNPLHLVLVEGELWPNLVRQADRRGVPVSLVNGRMSDKSFRGYRLLRPLTADVLRRIDPLCVQGETDAERLRELGAPPDNIHVVGTAKFDVVERDPDAERQARDILRRAGVPADALVLLGGSTWPGEEEILCSLYRRLRSRFPRLFLVLAPRHVERAPEVIRCLEKHGLRWLRRSAVGEEPPAEPPEVLFLDTTGELARFYAAANIAFVGKSLTAKGGQNPIEPAIYGKPILVGPHMENFPAVMPRFLEREAILQVNDAAELEAAVERLLSDEAFRRELGRRAAEVVEANRGAVERTVRLLEAVRERSAVPGAAG